MSDRPACVVALDFDGVVWDSVDEAFEMGWHAWATLHGDGVNARGATPVRSKDELRERFREARWQCRDGHDFYLVMRLLAGADPPDVGHMPADVFRRLRQEQASGPETHRFVEAFYGHRAFMREQRFDEWLALQRPYPGIVEQIRTLGGWVRGVAVATTKDAPSAEALLRSANLDGLPIFGREVSLDKRDHMPAIADRFDVRVHDIAFVDDLLENLEPLAPMGVRVGLAGWGYNTQAEREQAAARGLPVLTIERFAEQVLAMFQAAGGAGPEDRRKASSPSPGYRALGGT